MATSFFNPVFTLYNQALSDKEQSGQYQATNKEGDTRTFDDEGEAYNFSATSTFTLVENPAFMAVLAERDRHLDAIRAQRATIPANQPGAATWQLTSATEKYRLESIDIQHRMGDYLEEALKEFSHLVVKNANFWQWLASASDDQVKRWNPGLFEQAERRKKPEWTKYYLKWFRQGVKYLSDEDTRDRYWVEIKGGRLLRKFRRVDANRTNLDTKTLVDHVKAKYPGMNFEAIFVLSPADKFYSHVVKLGRFHHSSLLGGTAIKSAGEWGVEDGKLKWINGKSGHYRPEQARFVDGLEILSRSGVLATDAVVRLYNSYSGKRAAEEGIADFLSHIKASGQYYKLQGLEVFA